MASPISNRTNAQPLSLELLREHVPTVRIGQEAIKSLKDESTPRTRVETNSLLTQKRRGSRSQEALIISALPLIKNIASREFQRRKAWNSRVSYDDLLQEAIAGFIRGLLSYDETADHNSATNYLGQWITTSIRRKIEALEHDFAIPYEVVERARRIRAVHSRLSSELGRSPDDEELLEALNDPDGSAKNGYRWGGAKGHTVAPTALEGTKEPVASVPEDAKPIVEKLPVRKSTEKRFSQAHLLEARALAARSYALQPHDAPTSESDDGFERASTPLTIAANDDDRVDTQDLSASRNQFFNDAFISMKIGSRQKDIIIRFFGMHPYDEPQTQKEIIANTALPPRFVKSVITTFQTYMPQQGGVFHQLVLALEPDDIESLELTWLIPLLGDWPKNKKQADNPPPVLTQSTLKTSSKALGN
jgi:hypothetical protein